MPGSKPGPVDAAYYGTQNKDPYHAPVTYNGTKVRNGITNDEHHTYKKSKAIHIIIVENGYFFIIEENIDNNQYLIKK